MSSGQADQEAIRRGARRESERDLQGALLRFRERAEPVQQRCAELVQPGVGELHLGLDAGDLRDPER